MAASSPTSPLRQILEDGLSKLSSEVDSFFALSRERERDEFADHLNQAVRRIRIAPGPEELCATLLDAAGAFSTGAALFRLTDGVARCGWVRGLPEEDAEAVRALGIPLSSASALAGAVESRDPVTAITTAQEVSAELVQKLGHGPDGRVGIFPVVVSGSVPALVYAWGRPQGSAIELLTQVAAAVWTAFPKPAPPPLVTIAPAEPSPAANSWADLSPDERATHLRAQRFARVKVAEMRLFQAESVQAGRAQHNLYEVLRKPIDAARENFQNQFFASCGSMVDYLHLELTRTLANDDPDLLGNSYPGPLV